MQEEPPMQEDPQDRTPTTGYNIFNDATSCYTYNQLLAVKEGDPISH